MPYKIRKQKCKQSDGDSGNTVLSYTDKSGKKHRACHTSKKKAKGQIAAIEAESLIRRYVADSLQEKLGDVEMKLRLSDLRRIVKEVVEEELKERDNDRDDDGDKDFADVMMARMTAGGLSKDKAIKKSRKYDE